MSAAQLSALLDELQRRLEGPGKAVWDMTFRYTITNALLGIVVCGAILIAVPLVMRAIWRRSDGVGRDIEDVVGVALIACGVFYGLFALLAVYFIYTDVLTLLNPDYATLRSIIETVKP